MRIYLIFSTLLLLSCFLHAQDSIYINQALGKRLQVAVYDSPPFGMEYSDGSHGGLMVEIWEEIAKDLGINYDYHTTDMDGLLQGLQNGQYDVALGAISITPKRESLVDFTQAVNPSGTGVAVAADSRKSSFQMYWKPLLVSLLELIGSLLLVLLVSGTIVWLVEKKHNQHAQSDRNINGLADGLWWSAVTMTTVGYGDKVPNSQIGKALGIIWIFASIILLSLFTANASAIMTTTKMQAYINSEDDLKRSKVGAAKKSSGEEYLLRERIAYIGYNSVQEAVEAMLEGEIECVVSNAPVLKYLNNSQFYQKLAVSEQLLIKNNMGIALTDESPLREATCASVAANS